jgi:hypothetical protein
MKEGTFDKLYSRKRIAITVFVSIGIFYLVLSTVGWEKDYEGKHYVIAILIASSVYVILIPKILWKFMLDRVRELGKAIRGED